jgi:hypothetical protein
LRILSTGAVSPFARLAARFSLSDLPGFFDIA